MRRENADCVTWRYWAEREKLRVSARLTKSSSQRVSMGRHRGRVEQPGPQFSPRDPPLTPVWNPLARPCAGCYIDVRICLILIEQGRPDAF
jgi:hypothetical protein